MDDKQMVQARFRVLKSRDQSINPNTAFALALRWLQLLKSSPFFQQYLNALGSATLKQGDIKRLLESCQTQGSFTDAVRLVGKVFSDPFALGNCFPLPLESVAQLDDFSSSLSFLDCVEIDTAIQHLVDASPAAANAMGYALRTLTAEVAAMAPTMTEGDARLKAVRIAMIITRVPNITRAFILKSIASAPKRLMLNLGRHLLASWGISRSVIWLNTVLSEAIAYEKFGFSFSKVEPVVLMMNEIWRVNNNMLDGYSKEPESSFINPELSAFVAEDESFLDRDFLTYMATSEGGPIVSFVQCPFMLDTASKAHIIQVAAEIEQRHQFHQAAGGGDIPFLIIRVRRTNMVEDTMNQMARMPKGEFRKPLKVQFVGEEGVDAGGVRKEYFLLMLRQLLDPSYGMFRECDPKMKLLWFNPDSLEAQLQFELVGVLIGLAISNGVIIDVPFPSALYRLLLTQADDFQVDLNDLKSIDPQLAQGLEQLLEFTGDVESTFARSFEVSREAWGAVHTTELIPNGSQIPVTNENRQDYVSRYIQWFLVESVKVQLLAFRRGFFSVIDESLLRDLQIRASELELMIVGVRSLDFDALERSARYDDGYDAQSKTVQSFWRVAHSLSDEEKRTLLRFITGSDRVPIRGLSDVHIVISRAGSDSDLLPSSHTCFDHLLLPDYGDDDAKMRSKLSLALQYAEGFFTR